MSGRLIVIGLGPGNADQVTPEASRAVAEAKFFTATNPISTGWTCARTRPASLPTTARNSPAPRTH